MAMKLGPFRTAVELIMSIPGIKNLGAHVIVSEIGIDMSRFPSDAHLISWACICPRNDESAGKRRSNRLRKGGTWLKTTLVQCAWAAVKKKDSYLQAQFHRIRAWRGPKKAIMAVLASILTAIYHMLKDGTMYKDLGSNHFDRRSADQQKKAWSNAWPTLAMLRRSSRSPPEPCLWHRQGESVAQSEQVSFLLEIHTASSSGVGSCRVRSLVDGVGHHGMILSDRRQRLRNPPVSRLSAPFTTKVV
jgi:hypothetical protein